MLKVIVITIVCIVSLIVGLGNYKQLDKTMPEDEKNILLDVENVVYEDNTIGENIAKEDVINENSFVNELINNVKEDIEIEKSSSTPKEEIKVNNNKESNKTINKPTESNSKIVENKVEEKKEEVVKENNEKVETKQEVIVEEKTEPKVEETKEEVKENPIVQETKYEYVYNYSETQRLKNDIHEAAKGNPDLFDEKGDKLYRVSEFSSKEEAMNRTNYFSPYNFSEVKGVVQNTYSCTFLVYAIDYKINGVLQQTRYYIKVSQY